MSFLRYQTSTQWADTVLGDFDRFLQDHAAAEKKASGMAVSMLSHYPDRTELVKTMSDLAVEEMCHFREVMKIIYDRGGVLGGDEKDPYVNQLRKTFRKGTEVYFLDRLLIGGIIEARGCERFGLVGEALSEPKLKQFYRDIAASEARHHETFVNLAHRYFAEDIVHQRLDQLLTIEAEITAELPLRPALH